MRGCQLPNPVLILLSLLLPRDASATSKPQYLVLVPSQLYAGVTEKACVVLNHLNESVELTVTLEYEMQSRNLLTDMGAKHSFYCSSFMIPESSSSSAFITVQVKGPTQHFVKRKWMHITKAESLVFVQTDKPIYKPGQTVRFRIVSVDVNFHPLNEMFPVVYIENPKKNRIFQWHSVNLHWGLNQLSFPLSVEPTLGPYKVILQKESGKKIEHSFEVNEYVLPKFEVQVKMPKTVGFLDDEFVVSVCSLYTYGKPVRGLVTINVCRRYSRYSSTCHGKHSQSICEEFSQQADEEGCFTQLVKSKIFHLRQKGYDMKLLVEAKVREEGTGLELTGHGSCKITNTLSKLKFTKVDSHYRRGLPFFGQVLLVDEKDQPIPNKTVVVSVDVLAYRASFTTNEHGLVNISIDTSNFTSSFISVLVTYKQNKLCFDNWWLEEFHTPAQHTVKHIFSPSKSYVHLEPVAGTMACGQTQEIRAHYILNGQILNDEKELTFYYLIKARGSIAQSGAHVLSIKQGEMKGVFSFSFQVESDIAPTAQLLIYTILPNGEVIADTEKLEIENCFPNKVNLSFSSARGLPASDINLKVTAAAYSLCALRAVDQSVLLMKPEAEVSPQSVYDLLPVKSILSVRYGSPMNEDGEKCINAEDITHNGIIYTPKQVLNDDDVYSIFESVGLNIFTNSKIHKPHFCQLLQPYPGAPIFYAGGQVGPMGPEGSALARGNAGIAYPVVGRENPPAVEVKETVRKYFPETWIWDLVALDISGRSELAVKVPDTITEWKAGALCLSGTAGLGLSPTISLTAFQPFFLELTLPYSVVRGEAFTLKATAFSYVSHCIRVSVQLEVSPAFLAIPVEKNEESHCVCGNKQKTVSWAVTPKSLGKVNFTATAEALQSQELCDNEVPHIPAPGQKDTVVKPLFVEPEGIEKEETFNTLLCASETGEPEKLSLKLPSNVVEGSARATHSVLGDILGSAMQNLQNLLQMPYGCGEQNMVLFAPNIYVLNYLNETGLLTEKIKSTAISHLISGYQRQLNYKHSDGSYSTFGDRHSRSQGNTWLTAFVFKSFAQAQSYIFVEDSHIMNSLTWLSQKQKENGCFQRSGSLLNNAIKGGVDDEVTLSAYITIALLEVPLPATHPVVRGALFCLERAWESTSEAQGSLVYTKALLAYAFALAGNQAKRSELLESLDKEAVKEEDSIHWQRPGKPQEVNALYYQPRAPSVEVEMTAYTLLAYLTAQPAPSSEDLSVATRIVKWITKQQNPSGGFSSTQDTVVALQALSKYGAATFTKREKAATVTIKSSETFSEEFQVDEGNRLLLQEVALPEVPGEYSMAVSGSGCVYLQTSLRYNILPKKEGKSPFTLKVDTLPKNCDGVNAHSKVQILINISYTGERPSSNMVIVDVKMVSGFIPVKASVKKLQERPQIQRTDVSTNHVLIYFEELTHQSLSFSFSVERNIPIKNLKPATVKAYDYYETEEFTIEEYSVPCSTESEHGNA
ncbi:pregnancy zone protein-like [Neophocaena asiaeorientalis asiaeorientalis]|uniref:Pregnancy zone protein-like n=1 Tax=Neophocaena asiaeorientalis asiaeorientalis TaxID=1706337 RepID=A0A341AE49_NEOAA|nr:pregnancy zone protein-like [Neophocaena asiaeorientalis asiaeorientalis]